MMNWSKRLLILIAIAASIAVLTWAFLPKPVTVQLATVTRGHFQQVVEEDGKTRVRERYVVSAPLTGKLQRITLKAGDHVARQQVVATLLPSAPGLLDVRTTTELTQRVGAALAQQARAAAEVASTQAALEKARADLKRARTLADSHFISPAQLEQYELTVKLDTKELEAARYAAHAAQHDVATARAALLQSKDGTVSGRDWPVTAPVAGEVLKITQESEGVVSVGAPLLEIGNPGDLEIAVDVLTSDATLIKPGAAVIIRDSGQTGDLQGRVRLIEPSAFTKISALGVEEQRVNVIIDLTSPTAMRQRLGDGYKVVADIIVFSSNDAIKVPVSALFRKDGQWAVFVAENGRAAVRPVQIARRSGLEAMVDKGLKPGEKVIIYPGDLIRPGVRIKTD